jgi:hypothetical protein
VTLLRRNIYAVAHTISCGDSFRHLGRNTAANLVIKLGVYSCNYGFWHCMQHMVVPLN